MSQFISVSTHIYHIFALSGLLFLFGFGITIIAGKIGKLESKVAMKLLVWKKTSSNRKWQIGILCYVLEVNDSLNVLRNLILVISLSGYHQHFPHFLFVFFSIIVQKRLRKVADSSGTPPSKKCVSDVCITAVERV